MLKTDKIAASFFLFWYGVILSIGCYQLYLRNQALIESPTDRLIRALEETRDLGFVQGRMSEIQATHDFLNSATRSNIQKIEEASAKIDIMKLYFDKYKPEIFEKQLVRFSDDLRLVYEEIKKHPNHADLRQMLVTEDYQRNKTLVLKTQHDAEISKLTNDINRLNTSLANLSKRLEESLGAHDKSAGTNPGKETK